MDFMGLIAVVIVWGAALASGLLNQTTHESIEFAGTLKACRARLVRQIIRTSLRT